MAREQLRELRRLGTSWVSLTPFGFVESLESARVRRLGETGGPGETGERLRGVIRHAHAEGLRVMLKPHLWVRNGAWRAELRPREGWDAFFASYEAMILAYARMAAEENVAILAIGTELRSSIGEETKWRALIERVREIYRGELVYCANWDEAEHVGFWDALDYVGVQFYPSLADAPGASEAAMRARLDRELDRLEQVHRRAGRPLLITEVGYKSVRGAEVRPYEWTERLRDPTVDLEAQARAYRVFLSGVSTRPWIRGVYVWKWFTDPDTREEGPAGFSPRGKPAEAVLRAAFRAR